MSNQPGEIDLLQTTDARVWAEEWYQIFQQPVPEDFDYVGWMIGWFASAMIAQETKGRLYIRDLESRLAAETARADKAEAEAELRIMQLAACGMVAMANTPESAAKVRDMKPEYWCASVQDVARMVDSEMALRARLRAVEGLPGKWLAGITLPSGAVLAVDGNFCADELQAELEKSHE